jgi:CRISPR-associated endonuclease/helicase Cas3
MLSPNDFASYFEAVHGHPPFAWQRRLLQHVLNEGWAAPIDLPTASGKTAVIDVAVFALALQAEEPNRRTPRRVVLVVDRRIVVDEAYVRACRIRDALDAPATPAAQAAGVLARVRESLLRLGGERPLDCAALRGGMHREHRWARTPLQPVVLCSTVDQVGSRLLHRGYGLSPNAWPIHAGLLGTDTLIVLDEAHCVRPFLETLEAVSQLRKVAREPLPSPWGFVPMTATPPPGGQPAFRLAASERTEPVLARRIKAAKAAKLQVVQRPGDEGLAECLVTELTTAGSPWVAEGTTTLVVVNRVHAARLVFDELQRRVRLPAGHAGVWTGQILLLTGRTRPLERSELLRAHHSRIMAGRKRDAASTEPPLVVVATQCIEVGADLDVDALLTEACPLDSLRQRFGRLDRLGYRGYSPALICCRPEYAVQPTKKQDPVYGDRISLTWQWLRSVAHDDVVDFGVDAFDKLSPPAGQLAAPSKSAPLLFPAYCDLWVQTSPAPPASPDPSVFLHGPESGLADVGIVWRADLASEKPETWAATVAMCPPAAGEVMQVPWHVARAWLTGAAPDLGTDIEGERADDKPGESTALRALRWAGVDGSVLVDGLASLSPGDVLVLPCDAGGADRYGWTGRPRDLPSDLVLESRLEAQRPAVLRVHGGLSATYWAESVPPGWDDLCNLFSGDNDRSFSEEEFAERVVAFLPSWVEKATQAALIQTLSSIASDLKGIRVTPHPSGQGIVVSGRRRLGIDAPDFSDEDDLSSLSPQGVVTLEGHLSDVREWARRIGATARLPQHLVDTLALAGYLHDLGKADPRFQAWLVGGDRFQVNRQQLLAKSDRIRVGLAAQTARRRSGYPVGARHELLSVRLAESAPALLPSSDVLKDLVLHLVASHHGRCRPWAPVVDDERPLTVRHTLSGHAMLARTDTQLEALDSGVAERFWRLVRHFGWWGLSYLETCLRLADHRASEQPGQLESTL